MKYVFSTFVYFPIIGGIQVYIGQIASYLIKEGNDVCVITTDKKIRNIIHQEIDGIRILRIPAFDFGGFYFLKKKRQALAEIENEIQNADLVHVNAPKLLYKYFATMKDKYRYRLVATSHGWFYHTKRFLLAKNWYFKNIIVKYAPQYDAIINVSFQDQEIGSKFCLKNTYVIENGVDIYKYANLPEKNTFSYRFVYYGRVANNKGLLECLKKLNSIPEDFIFDVAGNYHQKYMDKLKSYIKSANLTEKVRFWGKLPDSDIRLLLSDADIILMPSLHEGFGMALVECLLSKRPIIANNNDSFRSILKNVDAELYLFDYQDPQSDLYTKIHEVMENPISPRNVEQYSVDLMIKKTIEIYDMS